MIPLLIDSGAYSAWRKKEAIDLNDYIAWLLPLIEKYPHVTYMNLDVIDDRTGEESYRNFTKMREKGLKPIPIYHVMSPEKWLARYLHFTDHICIGTIARLDTVSRSKSLDRVFEKYIVDDKKMPKVKVHGLGITSFTLMARYPWYSVDSTAVLQQGMYGKVWVPRRIDGKWDFDGQPLNFALSTRSSAKKEKGKHIDSISPIEKQLILDYLEFMGFRYGSSNFEGEGDDEKEVVITPGVSNDYSLRCMLNAQYMSRFMQTLPWPRPLSGEAQKGIFS